MVVFTPCAHSGCGRFALTQSAHCFRHLPRPGVAVQDIMDRLESQSEFVGWNISELSFIDFPLEGKTFYNCLFSHCVFPGTSLQNCRFETCFFDFSMFSNCSWKECTVHNSTFAGSDWTAVEFTDCTLLQSSFNGIRAGEIRFASCDLFRSTFIAASLEGAEFEDCNLKRVNLCRSRREKVHFQWSNELEAIYSEEEVSTSRYTPLEKL